MDYDPLDDEVEFSTLRRLIGEVIIGELRSIWNVWDRAGEMSTLTDYEDLGMDALRKSISEQLDFSALMDFMADNNSPITFQDAKYIVKRFDRDNDGVIGENDFKYIFVERTDQIGEYSIDISRFNSPKTSDQMWWYDSPAPVMSPSDDTPWQITSTSLSPWKHEYNDDLVLVTKSDVLEHLAQNSYVDGPQEPQKLNDDMYQQNLYSKYSGKRVKSKTSSKIRLNPKFK